jgi:glucose/arabinose dehydrogenase
VRYWWIIILISLLLTACSSATSEIIPSPISPKSSAPVDTATSLPSSTAAVQQDTPVKSLETSPTTASTLTEEPTPSVTASVADNLSVEDFPDPQGYVWELVANRLNSPVGLVHAGDGSQRIFILEQNGRILILHDGVVQRRPFLDIRDRIDRQANEQGLLGLAFHPQYRENGFFYINYTDTIGDTVIARYSVSGNDPNQANPDSEQRLLHIQQPYGNHNGGAVVFGPDGYLYLGLGDGGNAGDPHGNGQSTDSYLGSILRIDVEEGDLYSIPEDNPFVDGGGLPEIWAYGLRNPWRISFDRLTGDLYIGDVGQNAWEEIDFLASGSPPGANFGWNYREGTHLFQGAPPPGLDLIDPIAEYNHSQGCSVTSGHVYRGAAMPEWQGVYLYGDFCSGSIWGLLPTAEGSWQSALLFQSEARITSFGEDESGEVYMLSRPGEVFRLSSAQ